MSTSNELRKFIEEHIEWIDIDAYPDLYRLASNDLSINDVGELTNVFNSMDIDPIDYMTYIPHGYFANHMMGDYEVPDHIREIEDRAFYNTELNSVDLRNVEKLHDAAFEEILTTDIYLPRSIRYIGGYCFAFSSVHKVVYEGTRKEWALIQKEDDWNALCDVKKVYCSDGVEHVEEW